MHTIDIIILTVVAALLLLALRSTLRHYGGKGGGSFAVVPAVREEALPRAPGSGSRLWSPGNRQVRTSPKRFRLKECTVALAKQSVESALAGINGVVFADVNLERERQRW